MILGSVFGILVCRFRGHAWRRLHKGEVTAYPDRGVVRICARCGDEKLAKMRQKKAATP